MARFIIVKCQNKKLISPGGTPTLEYFQNNMKCYKNMTSNKMEYGSNGKISLILAQQGLEQEVEEEIPVEERLTTYIYENLMGRESTFKGPFGRKQVVYADLISTGRSLRFLEHFMMNEVLPALSDSEAMTTVTGLQSMLYLDETR